MAALTQAQIQEMNNLEVDSMADMYNRMSSACLQKCVAANLSSAEISKNEAVCQDRCVAKFLSMYDTIGNQITEKMQESQKTMDEMNKAAEQKQATQGS